MSNYACNVDLRRLRYFLVVAEELNYTRAAQRLRIAGPSLSQQIMRLERELKVQLFERDRRSVKLTSSGSVLLPHVQALVAEAHELQRRADGLACGQVVRLGLVSRCPGGPAELASEMASVEVDSWVMPSHTQAKRVSIGNLDLAICHTDTDSLEQLGLSAHLIRVDRLDAICAGTATSPVNAVDTAVLIEADASIWWSWNQYAEQFAEAAKLLRVDVDDGGISGRGLQEHARRVRRPIINAPRGSSDLLPRGMARRPVINPIPLWTWSLVQRRCDQRPAVHAVMEALTRGVAGFRSDSGAHWLPPNDPYRGGYVT